jgi:CRP/FNR family transcriptional regulator
LSETHRANHAPATCEHCGLARVCFPAALSSAEARKFSGLVQRGKLVGAWRYLCRAGEQAQSLYIVRSGSLKIVDITSGGAEAVVGFYLPGEVVGLDALAGERHPHDVIALEQTRCCALPLSHLEELLAQAPGVRRELIRMISRALDEIQRRTTLRAGQDAQARVAAFILDVGARLDRHGLASSCFRLGMRWRDAASYLGLTFETVSRALAGLRKDGALEVRARNVVLKDRARLAHYARGEAGHAAARDQPSLRAIATAE